MLNEQECTKILNTGKFKFTHDEMLLIREFVTKLALIEFESYKRVEYPKPDVDLTKKR